MLKKNLKLALLLIFWGVVFGLSFASPVKAVSFFDVEVDPLLSTPGTPIRFTASPEPLVDKFKFFVLGSMETDEGTITAQFFTDEIISNTLDYSYSGLIGKGPYFYTSEAEELFAGLIKPNQPLPIDRDKSSNTFTVFLAAYYQNKLVTSTYTTFTLYRLPYHPVLFIHGLGGRPDSWQSGDRNYFQLLEDNGYLSSELLAYGYAGRHRETNGYNYDGAVEDISSDMEQAIATLSAQSTDGKVDIVAYSLGNLVARYYLATHKTNHKVRKVISIAGPHKGSYLMDIDQNIQSGSPVDRFLERLIVGGSLKFAGAIGATDGEVDRFSPATQQIISNSSFLTWLNIATNTPSDVKFYPLYGDIHVVREINLFHFKIRKEADVGDFVILPESASTIEGAVNPDKTAYKETGELKSKLVKKSDGSYKYDVLGLDSFRYKHDKIIEQQELKDKVKEILMSD